MSYVESVTDFRSAAISERKCQELARCLTRAEFRRAVWVMRAEDWDELVAESVASDRLRNRNPLAMTLIGRPVWITLDADGWMLQCPPEPL